MRLLKPPTDNLGTRHRALNSRVNEAVANNTPFDAIEHQPESTDVDKLYKIDLAAKYKNVQYIIEILKSGDSLYISRALKKCQWLYEDDLSHIFDPEYLDQNIFPFNSSKMKRKIVKTAAAHVKKPERAVEFFNYCMKETMIRTALTYLIYTSDEFKIYQLRNNERSAFKGLEKNDMLFIRLFVGKSFAVLDALLDIVSDNTKKRRIIRQFDNWFNESEKQYLDLVEKHMDSISYKFDVKKSDAIMRRHKHRVLTNPDYYLNAVDRNVLVKNSTNDEAKIYAAALLPDTASEFWHLKPNRYSLVLEIVGRDGLYAFLKNYFAEHYPNEEFEKDRRFYNNKYYKYMTIEQREQWASDHLNSQKQLLGVGRDFLWYRFINFEEAFEEIKRYISVTQDADTRSEMVEVLVDSAKNYRELETLFKYYSKRHMNEGKQTGRVRDRYIVSFLKKTLDQHNVFEFDEDCWIAFYSLILAKDTLIKMSQYKTIAVLWYILHQKEMPQVIVDYFVDEFIVDDICTYLKKKIPDQEKRQMLHEYFFTYYMNLLKESKNDNFEHDVFENKVKPSRKRYFLNIDSSMRIFNEKPLPSPSSLKKEDLTIKKKRFINENEMSGRSLLRELKKDKQSVINKLTEAQERFNQSGYPLNINKFLKKIKIYFPDDVTKVYLDMFTQMALNANELKKHNLYVKYATRTGVNAIFQLADENTKIEFIKMYAPVGTKEVRKILGIQHLRIQQAICQYIYCSRPHVPLSVTQLYLKEGLLKRCLHIFNRSISLLPLPMCQEFVRLILDAPVSIQKHAIRLAFRCFDPEDLKEEIVNIWNNTKNVSLRRVIYKAFFNKVVETKETIMFVALKTLTLNLNQDDENEIFKIIMSREVKFPEEFLGDFLETVWLSINKFKDLEPNITRKKNVIVYMREHIHLVREDFASTVVNDHINKMILENKVHLTYSSEDIAALYKEKWLFVALYILHYLCSENPQEKYVQLVQNVISKNIERWDEIAHGIRVHKNCCWDFLMNLKTISLQQKYRNFEDSIPVFDGLLNCLDTDLKFFDSYFVKWEILLLLITANVMKGNRKHLTKDNILKGITDSINEFGQGVGKLISEYVERNTYCKSFSSLVKDRITYFVEELLKLIIGEIYKGNVKKWDQYMNTALISLAATLVKFDPPEAHLLAVQLLPTSLESPSEEFRSLIREFKKHSDVDVQLYVYQTFELYLSDTKETC